MIYIPIPLKIQSALGCSRSCSAVATTATALTAQPVNGSSLDFLDAGNSNLDVALGCGVSNLVNWER
jgi:hypothetical protein